MKPKILNVNSTLVTTKLMVPGPTLKASGYWLMMV